MEIPESSLFEKLGGRACLERVHKILYDRLFADPWLGQFFVGKDQVRQENQQTDFMTKPLGGKAMYFGKFPKHAHSNLFITEEMFEYRSTILKQALEEAKVPTLLANQWLEIDRAFKSVLVKKSVSECQGRFANEEITVIRDTRARAL